MKKPEIEITKRASDFLDDTAVKRMSGQSAAQARGTTQFDLPPWKRDMSSVMNDAEEQVSGEGPVSSDKESNLDVPLWQVFDKIFANDDAYKLLGLGAAGGFGAASILLLFTASLAGDKFTVLQSAILPLVFIGWTSLVVGICHVRQKKKVSRVICAMSSEMDRLKSELHSSDLVVAPSKPIASSIDQYVSGTTQEKCVWTGSSRV